MRLVHTFHSKVRHDAVLAPIFESNADDLARRIAGSLWYGYQVRHGAPPDGGLLA